MSSYVVLARKWRPRQFQDIVGQGHIVQTLMNAARADRIHQAYLFTGSRGIGKTTIARIFAKLIRCESPQVQSAADDTGETKDWQTPCGECGSCREYEKGSSVDVIEIDGASNNGVDAIREIRENAKYLPSHGKKKVYIIDEVHMLSTAAFNALLKTLEEPPAHVVFIFATTEPHKIPATILSRCQRFDFRRYTIGQITGHLSRVSEAEKIEVEPAALREIAKAAEGGMRDALSILDQVISFAGQKVTLEAVSESMGLLGSEQIFSIMGGVLSRQPKVALRGVAEAYRSGHDLKVLTRSLLETLHHLILVKADSLSESGVEVSETEATRLKELAAKRELEELELMFQVLHHGTDAISRSPQPKAVMDILLIKCAMAEGLFPLQPNPQGHGTRAGQSSPSAASSVGRPASRSATGGSASASSAPRGNLSSATAPPRPAGAQPAAQNFQRPAPVQQQPVPVAPVSRSATQISPQPAPQHPPAQGVTIQPQPQSQVQSQPARPPGSRASDFAALLSGKVEAVPAAKAVEEVPSQMDSQMTRELTVKPDLDWVALVRSIKKTRPFVGSLLQSASQGEVLGDGQKFVLRLGFTPQNKAHRAQLEVPKLLNQLCQLASQILGRRSIVEFVDDPSGSPSLSERFQQTAENEKAARLQAVEQDPVVTESVRAFGGKLGRIELLQPLQPQSAGLSAAPPTQASAMNGGAFG